MGYCFTGSIFIFIMVVLILFYFQQHWAQGIPLAFLQLVSIMRFHFVYAGVLL